MVVFLFLLPCEAKSIAVAKTHEDNPIEAQATQERIHPVEQKIETKSGILVQILCSEMSQKRTSLNPIESVTKLMPKLDNQTTESVLKAKLSLLKPIESKSKNDESIEPIEPIKTADHALVKQATPVESQSKSAKQDGKQIAPIEHVERAKRSDRISVERIRPIESISSRQNKVIVPIESRQTKVTRISPVEKQ